LSCSFYAPLYVIVIKEELHEFHLVLFIVEQCTRISRRINALAILYNLLCSIFLDNSLLDKASLWWSLWYPCNVPLQFVTNSLFGSSYIRGSTYLDKCNKFLRCLGPYLIFLQSRNKQLWYIVQNTTNMWMRKFYYVQPMRLVFGI
jgi:hypothetical protein